MNEGISRLQSGSGFNGISFSGIVATEENLEPRGECIPTTSVVGYSPYKNHSKQETLSHCLHGAYKKTKQSVK